MRNETFLKIWAVFLTIVLAITLWGMGNAHERIAALTGTIEAQAEVIEDLAKMNNQPDIDIVIEKVDEVTY